MKLKCAVVSCWSSDGIRLQNKWEGLECGAVEYSLLYSVLYTLYEDSIGAQVADYQVE